MYVVYLDSESGLIASDFVKNLRPDQDFYFPLEGLGSPRIVIERYRSEEVRTTYLEHVLDTLKALCDKKLNLDAEYLIARLNSLCKRKLTTLQFLAIFNHYKN